MNKMQIECAGTRVC